MKKLLSIVFLLLLVASFVSVVPSSKAMTIPEGAVVKTASNPDVYIVKYKNGKQFKRLVLNPQVFESYGHLKWEDILTITQSEMNSFTESTLIKSDGENNVYTLVANGDSGDKALVDTNYTFDPDAVYIINKTDSGNYFLKKLENLAGKFKDIKLKIATPKIDFCNNIEGNQTSLPTGMYRDNNNCFTKVIIPEPTPTQNNTQETEDLKRTTIAVQALKQLAILTAATNNKLNTLHKQIEEKGKEEEYIKTNSWLSQSSRAGRLKIFYEEYNSLVVPYNVELEHYKKMISMQYVIEDFNNNIYISIIDRTFLGSIGINLN